MKKKRISIITQSCVWITLILISMAYLNRHPAEKVGIFSSLDFIYQKVTWVGKMFHGWSQWELDSLTQFKNSFQELQQLSHSVACEKAVQANQISKEQIEAIVQNLDSTSAQDFEANKSKYITIFTRINEEIQKHCQ